MICFITNIVQIKWIVILSDVPTIMPCLGS